MKHGITTSERRSVSLDGPLIGAVSLFAFLASSFLESSGEIWSHLATGRRLAQSGFSLRNLLSPVGIFDWSVYALYDSVGGAALIVLKALAITVLAWLLLLPPRRSEVGRTWLAACTLLALLALSPYVALRPALLSYFLAAGMLRQLLAPSKRTWRRGILLGLLFVLWVSLNLWPGLGSWRPASPWQAEQLRASIQHFDLAKLAYPILMGLGLVSLMLPGIQERNRRALIWTGLAALSSWQTALVPFFVLAAGPIVGLNLQDAFCRSTVAEQDSPCRRWGVVRFCSLVLPWILLAGSVMLIFLAAIGGLHGLPRGGPLPGWEIDADPSSRQFVTTLHHWRQRGWLRPEDRLLTVPHDLVPYFAWFAPQEQVAEEQFPSSPRKQGLQTACRSGKGDLVAVDDPDLLRELAGDSEQWVLLYVEGRFTLWGWKEACAELARRQPFAPNRLAFAPSDEDWTILPPVPTSARQDDRSYTSFLDRFPPRRTLPRRDSEAATTFLRYFQAAVLPPYQRSWVQGWSASAASLTLPPPPHALSLVLRLELSPLFLRDIDKDLSALPLLAIRAARRALSARADDANAYLRLGQAYWLLWGTAGEHARCRDASFFAELRYTQVAAALEQATRLDADSQAAHRLLTALYLEQGYLDAALDHRRQEARLVRRGGPRHGEDQQTFAQRLERLEQQLRALEGTIRERQKRFASLPASVTQPRERAVEAVRLGLARQALDDILLPSSPILLESSGFNLELELLLRLGRLEPLRQWMQSEEWEKYGANLGLHNLPAPPLPGYPFSYSLPAAPWFRFVWAVAQGDYDLAQGRLRELLKQVESLRQEQVRSLRRSLALTVAEELLLSAQPELLLIHLLGHKDRVTATRLLIPLLSFGGDRADLSVLAGTLALEYGWPRQAERHFETALGIGPSAAGNRPDFAARPLAEYYLQRLRVAQRAGSVSDGY